MNTDRSLADAPLTQAVSRGWRWIPTLYFAEGIPYVVVMTVSAIMYKDLQVSNTEIALLTSGLYLPWVIKPLWSPLVDIVRTKRLWIVAMQLLIGAALTGVALALPTSNFIRWTMVAFWLMAISSATHDIAADGFYMLGLSPHGQTWFVGIRSTFYRLAMISGQGLLVILAGRLAETWGSPAAAWGFTFYLLAFLFFGLAAYHQWVLPRPATDLPRAELRLREIVEGIRSTFASFFRKPHILMILSFLLCYRFAEAQLGKIAPLFLMDAADAGGLGLKTAEVGGVYGTVGVAMLTLGGILGGLVAARHGLKYWIRWMVLAINVPNLVYVYLSLAKPTGLWLVSAAVGVEQFGYGFGFTAYMLYMLYVSGGEHETAHYALCTGFMALGMMIPGMFSGALQELLGYRAFFLWVMVATLPSFLVTFLIPLDENFGRSEGVNPHSVEPAETS